MRALAARPYVWLFPVIVFAACYQPLVAGGHLSMGPVAIEPTDIGIAVAVMAAVVFWIRRGHPLRVRSDGILVAGIIALLCAPIFIGFANGHTWQSALYEARVVAAMLLYFATRELVRDAAEASQVLLCILAVALLGAAVGLAAHIFGWTWTNGMSVVMTRSGRVLSRGYGWWSAMPWYAYGGIVAASIALLAQIGRRRRLLAVAAASALALSTFSTLIRGDLLGLFVGIASISLLAFIAAPRAPGVRRRLLTMVVAMVCLLVLAGGITAVARPDIVGVIGERTASIFAPRTSSTMAEATRADRVEAAVYGINAAWRHPLGIGYGYAGVSRTVTESRARLFSTHSGIAWTGLYLGLIGGVLLVIAAAALLVMILARTARANVGTEMWTRAAALGIVVAMVAQSLAASVLFADHYTYPLGPIALAIASMPLAAIQKGSER